MTRLIDNTNTHPDHDGWRAQHLDGWYCTKCGDAVPTDVTIADTLPIGPLTTVREVAAWFAAMAPHGGCPHPDDSAYDDSQPDGAGIVGPLFVGASPNDRQEYDERMSEAHDICNAAGVDIYRLAMRGGRLPRCRSTYPGLATLRGRSIRCEDYAGHAGQHGHAWRLISRRDGSAGLRATTSRHASPLTRRATWMRARGSARSIYPMA